MAMGQVGSFQSKALRDLLTQLPSLIDLYQAPFDPSDPAPYKTGLLSHFEEQLSAELQRASAAAVVAIYEETQAKLIGEVYIGPPCFFNNKTVVRLFMSFTMPALFF